MCVCVCMACAVYDCQYSDTVGHDSITYCMCVKKPTGVGNRTPTPVGGPVPTYCFVLKIFLLHKHINICILYTEQRILVISCLSLAVVVFLRCESSMLLNSLV